MRWQGTCYRGHDPQWAFAPTSGEGAAAKGGRFNPSGMPALYLALTIPGIFKEMAHGMADRFDPLTVCTYRADMEDIVDLTSDSATAAGAAFSDMKSAWEYDLACHRTPASWNLAVRLIGAGAAGILTPSFATGAQPDMINLVLWKWGPDLPHKIEVYDPAGKLPRDRSSWATAP